MKLRVSLAVLALASTFALGGCAFLTPNWNALRPSSTPSPSETSSNPISSPTSSVSTPITQVDVIILNATADQTGIDIVAQASNISEDGGTCQLVVSQAGTKKLLVVKGEANVTDTQCFPFHLPLTGFASGVATFSVSYKSNDANGVSAVGQVVIP